MVSLIFILLYVISSHGLVWVYLELPGLPGPVCLFPSPEWESFQSLFIYFFFFKKKFFVALSLLGSL